MRTMFDERKFTELMVYVADRLESDRSGGATKLNNVCADLDGQIPGRSAISRMTRRVTTGRGW